MKKIILYLSLFLSAFCFAQNDSIRKPVECGTQRIADAMEADKKNQKTIEDFIIHYKEDADFGLVANGIWGIIGKQNTDEDILKAGLKGYNWQDINIRVLKSMDSGNHHYILFSHQKGREKTYQVMAMYSKLGYYFRIYDAFYYKNDQHPEVLGEWKMSDTFSLKRNQEIRLEKTNVELEFGGALEIKEDYSFVMYDRCGCTSPKTKTIKGRYYFDAEGKINFYCIDIQYSRKKRRGKPFTAGPFIFKKEDGVLIFKRQQ